jgi:hypothetical protein
MTDTPQPSVIIGLDGKPLKPPMPSKVKQLQFLEARRRQLHLMRNQSCQHNEATASRKSTDNDRSK